MTKKSAVSVENLDCLTKYPNYEEKFALKPIYIARTSQSHHQKDKHIKLITGN